MVLIWKALHEAYPNAIIIGNFGFHHATLYKQDMPSNMESRVFGADLNDPLAEQLVYTQSIQNTSKNVHSIRIRYSGDYLNYNYIINEPSYTNNGAFTEVWHVKAQEHNSNSIWNPEDHVWAKGQ